MQVSLGSSSFEGVREVGGFGQPLHLLYPQIQAVLNSELGPEAASMFAEPVVDRASNRIDWYAQGDPDEKPVRLDALPEDQRQPVFDQLGELLRRGQQLVERYTASSDPRRVQLGAMLSAVLHPPATADVFLIQGQPVIIGWGFALDKPWDIVANPLRQTTAPASIKPAHDVAMPDLDRPALANAVSAPLPTVDLPPSSFVEPQTESSLFMSTAPLPTPRAAQSAPIPESLPEPSPMLSVASSSTASQSPAPVVEQPAPAAGVAKASPALESEPASAATFSYVVVGSRPFWSVFALAILLTLIAVFWLAIGRPLPKPMAGAIAERVPNAGWERALAQAQQTELELRARLEPLLVQLAERRSQCPLSAAANPALANPAARGSEHAGVISTVPGKTTGSHREHSPITPPITRTDTGQPIQPSPTVPGSATGSRPAIPATTAPLAEGAVLPMPLHSQDSNSGQAPKTPLPAPSSSPPAGANPPVVTPPSPPMTPAPASRSTAAKPSLDQALEEELAGRESVPSTPDQRQPPALSSTKAEPTLEERQEFASRMSAAGAATGEITATLLWNSPGDLDLVVRCPSGQQLDYRNPAECGGALDVDANSTRTSLSARPVENAFWPAGKAAPGNYEIAVRYAPRKDEQNPQQTPFQVRLVRDGQESVFKGAVRPNTVTPVTTFTVAR